MIGELRKALGLPEINRPEGTAKNGEFSQDFRAGLTKVNQDMQVVAVHGAPGEHQTLDTHRQNLIKAYQTANSIGDAAKNGQVIGAVAKVGQQTTAKAATINAGHEEWQKRQQAFDAAIVKIGELEDANHPTAPAFRKVSEAIQARAKGKDYQNANAAFDQLQPKLDAVVSQTTVQAGTGVGNAPGGDGGSKDSGKPPVVSKGGGTVDSVSSRTPSNTGGTIDTSSPPQKSPTGDVYTDEGKTIYGKKLTLVTPIGDDVKIRIKTSKGIEEMTAKEYRRRWYEAQEWLTNETSKLNSNNPDMPRRAGPSKELIKQAQTRFGLDDNWLSIDNRYIHGQTRPTRDIVPQVGTSDGGKPTANSGGSGDSKGKPKVEGDPFVKTQPPQAPVKGGDIGSAKTEVGGPYAKTQPPQNPVGNASPPQAPIDKPEMEKLSKTATDAGLLPNS